jgi:hypothetical protein
MAMDDQEVYERFIEWMEQWNNDRQSASDLRRQVF